MKRLFWGLLMSLIFLTFFFTIGIKVLYRIAALLGKTWPCPLAIAWVLELPVRLRTVPRVLDEIGIQGGERVLELGPGPGAFTVDASQRVGRDGQLIAVDIQPGMIARVRQKLQEAHVSNTETHVADAYHLPLDNESIDRAFLVTVLPEISDRGRALAELRRVLKLNGILSITEDFMDPDYLFEFETKNLVKRAGFTIEKLLGNVWHYTIHFRKAEKGSC
ncbi:MAG: methyltransferase domain-containing protein [Chloroflexi bacterium]|nr:methyltransferase domain-containing protein [Chloroflexota bacterium]